MRMPLRPSPIRISRSLLRLCSRVAMRRSMHRPRLRRVCLSARRPWPRTLTPSLSLPRPRVPGVALEIGAGRGTKTYVMMCQAKRAGYERQHTALDLHDRKCDQNLARLHKAGIQGVRTVSGDACELDEVLTSFDAMLGEPALNSTRCLSMPRARVRGPCAVIPRFRGA